MVSSYEQEEKNLESLKWYQACDKDVPLASTLFNLALEWVIRRVTSEGGVKLSGNSIGALTYANDVDLMGESLHEIDAKARSLYQKREESV